MDFDRMQNEILKNIYKEKDALSKRKEELQKELGLVDSNLTKILSAEKKLTASFEKLGKEAGEKVTFDQVLAVSDNGIKVGSDVANASVEASVVKEGRSKKVIVYKYKRKTGYHKKNGHRQAFTQVKIEKINA